MLCWLLIDYDDRYYTMLCWLLIQCTDYREDYDLWTIMAE